ncbi:hypothetical protein KC19_12G129900, partial [Ceratodon purpureus]
MMKVREGSLKELALEAGVAEMFVDLILPPRSSKEPRPYDHLLETLKRMDSNLATISAKLTEFLMHPRKSIIDSQPEETPVETDLAKTFLNFKRTSADFLTDHDEFDVNNTINAFFDAISKLEFKKVYSFLEDKPELVFEISRKERTSLNAAIFVNSEVMVRTFLNVAFKIAKKNIKIRQLLEVPDATLAMNSLQLATINGNKNMIDILEVAKTYATINSIPMSSFVDASIPVKTYWSKVFDDMDEANANIEKIRELLDPMLKIIKNRNNWNWYQRLRFEALRARSYLITSDEEASIEQSMLWGNEFVLHLLFGSIYVGDEGMPLLKEICTTLGSNLLQYILYLWDSNGRTPLHVLADNFDIEDYYMTTMFEIIDFHCPNVLELNIGDFEGRTPLFRAASQGNFVPVRIFAEDLRTKLNATTSTQWNAFPRHSSITRLPASTGLTALHIAVLHNHRNVVEALLHARKGLKESDFNKKLDINSTCAHSQHTFKITPFQLAAFKGHTQIIQLFLKEQDLIDKCIVNPKRKIDPHSKIPAISLATANGNPLALQIFLSNERVNPNAIDVQGNTALHYAAKAFDTEFNEIYFFTSADYVSIEHFCLKSPKKNKRPSEVIGCMELLMQAGFDMNKTNFDGYCPELSPATPEDVRQWWYEKFTKQTQEHLNNLFGAANAVSVTAALVATASFAGPLQPPLGLASTSEEWLNNYAQFTYPSVEAFFFCDNLTFYLSMSSIILALIPFLPITHEGILREVQVAQKTLQAAVVVLFMSIIFLICAFFSAAVSIVPKEYWRYKSLTMFTSGTG